MGLYKFTLAKQYGTAIKLITYFTCKDGRRLSYLKKPRLATSVSVDKQNSYLVCSDVERLESLVCI